MKWVKQNLIVIVPLCIFIVFLVGSGWLAQDATRKLGAVEADLSAKRTTLDQMRGSKPYPSKENFDLLQKDAQRFTGQYEVLGDAASKGVVRVPDKLDLIVFQQSLYQTWDRLQQSAVSANVKLPERFTFGFNRYLNAAPCADAKADECAQRLRLLMKELLVVEKVTDLLISNRVESIRAVRRAEAEPNPGPDSLGAVATPEPSSLYTTLPFEFQFGCDTASLRGVLNGLSQSEHLFIIRSLTVSTELVQVQPPAGSAVNPFSMSSSARSSTSLPATIMRRRLAVTVRLDLVEFPQPQKGNQIQQPSTAHP
jgi:hypothetical protein